MANGKPVTLNGETRVLGKGRKLLEGRDKITGLARFSGDVMLPRMLHLRPVLSSEAHARIVSIDTEAAKAAPGIVAVFTAEDLPSKDRVITSRNSSVCSAGGESTGCGSALDVTSSCENRTVSA